MGKTVQMANPAQILPTFQLSIARYSPSPSFQFYDPSQPSPTIVLDSKIKLKMMD